ncbi:MAG: hypothetical protein GY816_03810 [Cytophagales bacterium]|nr:hypothetical protein [Cytophagales bacterium]
MKKWIFLFLVVILAASCEDDNTCGITERSDEVFMAFFNYENKELLEADFDSVGVEFANEEEFFIADTTASILPIDLNGSATDFTFYTDSIDFQFRLSYRSEIFIENEECDPVFRVFALEGSTMTEELDFISIKVLELSKLTAPHVEIYF